MGKPNKILVAHRFIERYESCADNAYKAEHLYWKECQSVWRTEKQIKLLYDIIHWAEMANGVYDCAFIVGIKGLVDVIVDTEKRLQVLYDSNHDMGGLINIAYNHLSSFGDYKKVTNEQYENIARLKAELETFKRNA